MSDNRRGLVAASALPAVLLVGLLAVLVTGCTPSPEGGGGTPVTTASTASTVPTTYKEGRCTGSEGVTVVVDFASFSSLVVVRCALGPQASGRTVLQAAGFTFTQAGPYAGSVCQLNGLPTQGYPYCWSTGGYWSYWRAPSAGLPWSYSDWGFTNGPTLAPGAVEGWRFGTFVDDTDTQPPRVGTAGPVVP